MVQLLRSDGAQVISADPLGRFTIAAGRLFFRYRNNLFPTVFLLLALTMRPDVILNHRGLDRALVISGAAVAVLGELFRMLTIGLDYIDRGGRNGQAYASRLVQKGMYAHTRNPMYLGNLLIAIGMAMFSGSRLSYLIVIPFFLFVYHAITVSEEIYLRGRFGQEYETYCTKVPRLFPSLRGVSRTFSEVTYNWRRALRQDLSTLVGLLSGLALVPLWRAYFLYGVSEARRIFPRTLFLEALVLVGYLIVHRLKKQGRLA